MANKVRCAHCLGEHESDPPDEWVDYRGYRFTVPFLCMCCGKETCARQWAYGRTCVTCDTGMCQPGKGFRPQYAHENPPWPAWGPDAFQRFVEHVQTVLLVPQKEGEGAREEAREKAKQGDNR